MSPQLQLSNRRSIFHLLDAMASVPHQAVVSGRGVTMGASIGEVEADSLFLRMHRRVSVGLDLPPETDFLVSVEALGRRMLFRTRCPDSTAGESWHIPLPASVITDDHRSDPRWSRGRLTTVKFFQDAGSELPFDIVDLSASGIGILDPEGLIEPRVGERLEGWVGMLGVRPQRAAILVRSCRVVAADPVATIVGGQFEGAAPFASRTLELLLGSWRVHAAESPNRPTAP